MAKKHLVNAETDRDVDEFIESVKNAVRREDAKTIKTIISDITGNVPKIWGQSIIAYGKYKYQRKNGEEYEWFNVGFSPGSKHLTVYLMFDIEKEEQLLNKLGPHSHGRGCLYIKRLSDIDMDTLKKLITKSANARD
jgi:hypothetical protein